MTATTTVRHALIWIEHDGLVAAIMDHALADGARRGIPDARSAPRPAARLHQGAVVRPAQRRSARRPRTGARPPDASPAAGRGGTTADDPSRRAPDARWPGAGRGADAREPMLGVLSRPLGAGPALPARAGSTVMPTRRVVRVSRSGVPLATGAAQPGCIPWRAPWLPNGHTARSRRAALLRRRPTGIFAPGRPAPARRSSSIKFQG